MMYQKGTRAVKAMGCYNQYEARGCSYTECKSKHMLHTLALLGLVTNHGIGAGGGGGCYKTTGEASEVLPLQKVLGGGLKKL